MTSTKSREKAANYRDWFVRKADREMALIDSEFDREDRLPGEVLPQRAGEDISLGAGCVWRGARPIDDD
jgi:hypothetical protein